MVFSTGLRLKRVYSVKSYHIVFKTTAIDKIVDNLKHRKMVKKDDTQNIKRGPCEKKTRGVPELESITSRQKEDLKKAIFLNQNL